MDEKELFTTIISDIIRNDLGNHFRKEIYKTFGLEDRVDVKNWISFLSGLCQSEYLKFIPELRCDYCDQIVESFENGIDPDMLGQERYHDDCGQNFTINDASWDISYQLTDKGIEHFENMMDVFQRVKDCFQMMKVSHHGMDGFDEHVELSVKDEKLRSILNPIIEKSRILDKLLDDKNTEWLIDEVITASISDEKVDVAGVGITLSPDYLKNARHFIQYLVDSIRVEVRKGMETGE